MKTKITTSSFRSLITVALTATAITSSSTLSAAPLKRGEDPEFRAAWAALQATENRSAAVRTSARTPRASTRSLPVMAIGDTAQDICRAIRNRVRYTSDSGDTWQSAGDTWARRAGDCEDFAIAVRDLCRAKGIAADVHVFYPKTRKAGHAVTIGRSSDGLWMSSNGSFERVASVTDARNIIKRRHGWSGETVAGYKTIGSGNQRVKTSLL